MSRLLPSPCRPRPSPLIVAALAIVALAAAFCPASRAAENVFQLGNTIEVRKDATVHDAVCFLCSVNVKGTVDGDIVAFFGNVHLEGQANHDVVVFFGNVKAADNVSVGNDLVNFFGGVRLGENVTVGKDLVVMFGGLHAAPSASYGGSRVVQPGWLFWGPGLAIFLLVGFVAQEARMARRQRMYLRGY